MTSLTIKASTSPNISKNIWDGNVKVANTPIGTLTKLDMNETSKNIDITKYQGMFNSLFYLTTSRLDIMFWV